MNLPFEGVAHNIAIVKLNPEFPGHARKVINTLWGAGQMMFNKFLLVLPESININDYKQVVRHLAINIDISKDIILSEGPLDVLDHASSEFAFGGKMGIDGTGSKTNEIIPLDVNSLSNLKENIPEINSINSNLFEEGIPALIISLNDETKKDLKEITEKIMQGTNGTIKFLFFCNSQVDISDFKLFTWILTGNTDPVRDSFIYKDINNETLVMDGRRKLGNKNFERQWPNVLAMDSKTIELVDEKWKKYEIGEKINSPSLKYRSLIKGKKEIID
jgi:4-hydroxy-3-polyprenylbenzoate decarboxylase